MSLILSGTDGLSDVDGSAATPAIRGTDANTGIFFGADIIGFSEGGTEVARFNADAQFVAAAGTASLPVITTTGDTNTGIFFPAADQVAITTGGTQRVVVDASGNVGIGTSSPTQKFTAVNNSGTYGTAYQPIMQIGNTSSGGTVGNPTGLGAIVWSTDGTATPTASIEAVRENPGAGAASALYFRTGSSGGGTTRAVITASGNLLVGGTTSVTARLQAFSPDTLTGAISAISQNSGDVGQEVLGCRKFDNNSTTSQVFQRFVINNGGAGCGQINANGASQAAFGSFSDARLKENIVGLPSQLDSIMALRPVEFDYIESEGGGHQVGFIAQEMQEVYPDAVGIRQPDEMLTVTGWDKTTARLVKAIQELKAIVDAQAVEIAALKGTA
jgi:trimeric autotransporter adhesin